MKKMAYALLAAVVALAAYLAFWPVPVQPVAWAAPAAPGYQGAHAANTRLAGLTMIQLPKGEAGPEHVVLGRDGKLYAAMASGRILRMNPDGSAPEVFADTGGRVLGFDFDATGRLIAADAMKGLLAIDADGRVSVLADQVNGDPIRYADAVVVARSGRIYFSDASRRFAPARLGRHLRGGRARHHGAARHRPRPRVRPGHAEDARRRARTVLSQRRGAECGREAFVRDRDGPLPPLEDAVDAADLDVAARLAAGHGAVRQPARLPGQPDARRAKAASGSACSGPRNAAVDDMAGKPFLRALTLRLPRALWPLPKSYGHVFAFDDSGRVVADLQDPSGSYPETTGVTETADRLYIQNLHLGVLGWKPR